jgi:flagellar basal-body rod modification protein FlgD
MAIAAVTAPTVASPAKDPLAALSSNMTNFLGMLMTQLKNQDPTTPMDTAQFTTQLVQFSSVEQQININNGIQSLIKLSQSNNIVQSAGLIGKTVTATSTQMSVQKGTGTIQFSTPAAEPITIAVQAADGSTLATATLASKTGLNSWSWDGRSADGTQHPDGAYSVRVTGGPAGTTPANIPFTVTGVASAFSTGADGAQQMKIGALTLPTSSVVGVSA